jgi:surface antigen
VLANGDPIERRRSLYKGTGARRLCRPLRRLAAVAALLAALPAAGCAYQLDSIFPESSANTDRTGSIGKPVRPIADANTGAPSEADLAYARATAAEVLARGGRDISVPWENPQTGAGGNITPIAASYSASGSTCRDFLASYARGQQQSWLQGQACRSANGEWEVKSLAPMKRG